VVGGALLGEAGHEAIPNQIRETLVQRRSGPYTRTRFHMRGRRRGETKAQLIGSPPAARQRWRRVDGKHCPRSRKKINAPGEGQEGFRRGAKKLVVWGKTRRIPESRGRGRGGHGRLGGRVWSLLKKSEKESR